MRRRIVFLLIALALLTLLCGFCNCPEATRPIALGQTDHADFNKEATGFAPAVLNLTERTDFEYRDRLGRRHRHGPVRAQGGVKVIAIDPSPEMLAVARGTARDEGGPIALARLVGAAFRKLRRRLAEEALMVVRIVKWAHDPRYTL